MYKNTCELFIYMTVLIKFTIGSMIIVSVCLLELHFSLCLQFQIDDNSDRKLINRMT